MKFLSLALSLIISNCLAANNSNRSDSNPKPKTNTPETESNELENYIDMTAFHFAELRPKQLSIVEVSKMSLDELDIIVRESEKGKRTVLNEGPTGKPYIYVVNPAMANLIKKGKTLPDTLRATFDTWKDSSFSAANSLDFFGECMDHYSSREDQEKYCQFFKEYSLSWQYHLGFLMEKNLTRDITILLSIAPSSLSIMV